MHTRHVVAVFLLAATELSVSQNKECFPDKCHNYAMLRYYRELTCHPYNNSDACCPAAFDCSFLDVIDDKKCQYKGIVYEKGTVLYDEVEDPCAAECRCTETLNGVSFECTGVVCPEAEVYGQLPPNCFLKFDATHCCATGFHCLPDGNEEELQTEPTMKCIYNGYERTEGQYLSVDYPLCVVCVCEKGFDGTLNGPWCHKYTCDMMIRFKVAHLKRCAPIFAKEFSCCPHALHCPVGSDYVLQSSNHTSSADELHCSFGHLKLRRGDHLVSPGICVKCRCDVPPFVTCYWHRYEGCKFPNANMYGAR
ncbi:uncharacterized protein LOC126234359 [Schistocerca nitens]|uniref:uncharacterized protein LOC126234359 n=1 Tax=Schistocerca nitens TaxID=7011 RepID=UPI00211764D7|nr:uncharacterized protein LOC126234359 [Schistocerca nitens]